MCSLPLKFGFCKLLFQESDYIAYKASTCQIKSQSSSLSPETIFIISPDSSLHFLFFLISCPGKLHTDVSLISQTLRVCLYHSTAAATAAANITLSRYQILAIVALKLVSYLALLIHSHEYHLRRVTDQLSQVSSVAFKRNSSLRLIPANCSSLLCWHDCLKIQMYSWWILNTFSLYSYGALCTALILTFLWV